MTSPHHLFVYGSLRRNMQNPMAELLGVHASYIGPGRFNGKLFDLGHYPGVVASTQLTDIVYGDVYHLPQPADLLTRLDQYEGYFADQPSQSLYLRQESSVVLPAAQTIRA